jgi:hypothetical protein
MYDLRKTRAEQYRKYFDAFWEVNYKAGTPEHPAAHADYQKALHNLYVVASDAVFLATTDFHRYIVQHPTAESKNLDEINSKYAAMVIAMRKDGFEKTKLSNTQISSRLTFEV